MQGNASKDKDEIILTLYEIEGDEQFIQVESFCDIEIDIAQLPHNAKIQIQQAYQLALEDAFAQHVCAFLKKLLSELKKAKMLETILNTLNTQHQDNVAQLLNSERLPYQTLCNLTGSLYAQLTLLSSQEKNDIFAACLEALNHFKQFYEESLENYIQEIKTITAHKERHQFNKKKSSASLRTFIASVIPSLKKEETEVITKEIIKIVSLSTKTHTFTNEKMKEITRNDENYFVQFKEAIASNKKTNKKPAKEPSKPKAKKSKKHINELENDTSSSEDTFSHAYHHLPDKTVQAIPVSEIAEKPVESLDYAKNAIQSLFVKGACEPFIKEALNQESQYINSSDQLNQILLRIVSGHISNLSFEASALVTLLFYLLYENQNNQSNPLISFNENEMDFNAFLDNAAKSLGFSNIHALHQDCMEQITLNEKIKKLEIELKANAGWGFFPTQVVPRIQKDLEETKAKKAQIDTKINSLKNQITKNNFTSLKQLAQDALKHLKENTQAITLISSLLAISNQVQMIQKENHAAELLSPHLDIKMGFEPKIKAFWQELTVNSSKKETMIQYQDAIQQAIALVNEMLIASEKKASPTQSFHQDENQKETNL